MSLVIGGLYSFFAAAPGVLMIELGLTALELGLSFAATVLIVFLAGFLASRLARRWGPRAVGTVGLCSALAGGLAMFVFAAAPEAAKAAPLTEEITMLDQTLAARTATPRTSLRDAAAAVLAAWDDEANREADMIGALDAPMEALRTLLAGKPASAAQAAGGHEAGAGDRHAAPA